MAIQFYKYQGTGNDFILIDDRNETFEAQNQLLIKYLCDRKFGIGADGLMLLQNERGFDFKMVYFNSDGNESTMCGNGGRCIVAFAHHLGIVGNTANFTAIDGEHEAEVLEEDYIRLQMIDVNKVEKGDDYCFLDTGSPHYVEIRGQVKDINVYQEGKAIRYNDRFKEEGTNVNFLEITPERLNVRTYERGVENETLSCGTGIVASAITASMFNEKLGTSFDIKAIGGDLKVSFRRMPGNQFTNIWLEGRATQVYKGEIEF